MITYSKRENVVEKGEREWRITDDALIARSPSGEDDIGPWVHINAVRLAYAPTAQKAWRHLMELTFSNDAKWTIDNAHFKGFGNFEDRSLSYAPFVREVVAMIRQKSPRAKVRLGSAPVAYWLKIAFLLVGFLAIVMAILTIPLNGLPGATMIKFAIMLIAFPVLFQGVIRSRPRTAILSALPEDALPKVT